MALRSLVTLIYEVIRHCLCGLWNLGSRDGGLFDGGP